MVNLPGSVLETCTHISVFSILCMYVAALTQNDHGHFSCVLSSLVPHIIQFMCVRIYTVTPTRQQMY